jgi:hypothetical protein
LEVVPELAEHPGAEDVTQAWQREVDVGVRVLLKRLVQLRLQIADLGVEGDQQPHQCPGAGGVGLDERGRGSQLLTAQGVLDPFGGGVQVAATSTGTQRGLDLTGARLTLSQGTEQSVDGPQALDALAEPLGRELPTRLVHHIHVVVILCPVVADEDH